MKFKVQFVFPDKCKDEFELIMDTTQKIIYDLMIEKLYNGISKKNYYCLDDGFLSTRNIEIEFTDEQTQELLEYFIFGPIGKDDRDVSFKEALQISFTGAVLEIMTHYNMCNYVSEQEKEFLDKSVSDKIIKVMV